MIGCYVSNLSGKKGIKFPSSFSLIKFGQYTTAINQNQHAKRAIDIYSTNFFLFFRVFGKRVFYISAGEKVCENIYNVV